MDERQPASANTAVVLVARAAMTAAPVQEMERLAGTLAASAGHAAFAFTEQGDPSLRAVVHRLRDEAYAEVWLVPLLLPMEPGFPGFLTRTVQRWQTESPGRWPAFRIGQHGPSDTPAIADLLRDLTELTGRRAPLEPQTWPQPDGSMVPAMKRRVLVCMAGPCVAAGASGIWGHLRCEQKLLNLRTAGEGMMSARTSCLGPCSLAPVLQVYPENVYYGGVNEAAVDRIIHEHLLGGCIVNDVAYAPSATKQQLRTTRPPAAVR